MKPLRAGNLVSEIHELGVDTLKLFQYMLVEKVEKGGYVSITFHGFVP